MNRVSMYSFFSLMILTVSLGQPYPLAEDVSTLNGIIKAYYEVVSGPAGTPRQVERDKSLHIPDAQVVIIRDTKDGKTIPQVITLEEFHRRTNPSIEKHGFFEYEINRVVHRHGAIASVWSTYEYKSTLEGPVQGQGVNTIQLFYDGSRWWITSWMYDGRSNAPAVPKEYVPEGK